MKILVTGSSGLIGSETVRHFDALGCRVIGVDNNMRREFFGEAGDTTWCRKLLENETNDFTHHDIDIRNREAILDLFRRERFDAVVHCAAQPSHDRARDFPITDFEVNALGTLHLLEANRQFSPKAPFVYLSTNKVYGDAPNELRFVETETRWEYAEQKYRKGIPETFRIDASTHSVFGASKLSADVMVQEYGRYFGLSTVCLRGGCLTGPAHSGVELHGFLSYLIKCNLSGKQYTVFGYKGKQVRDNIHSHDVARFVEQFIRQPRAGAVYNIGGGKQNSISILEAFAKIEQLSGREMRWQYSDTNRAGDHICYYSDLSRMCADYPEWGITRTLDHIFDEIAAAWEDRLALVS